MVWEDGAALVSLLSRRRARAGPPSSAYAWDGVASLAIAVLLVAIAYTLVSRTNIPDPGRVARAQQSIADVLAEADGVDSVLELMTMRLSPEEVLVAARVDLADHLTPEEIEHAADEVDDRVKERFPEVRHLFLDPTPDHDEEAE